MQLTNSGVDDASENDISGLKYTASISDTSSNSDDLMNKLSAETNWSHWPSYYGCTLRSVGLVGFWFTNSEFSAEPLKAKSASYSYTTLARGHVYVSVSTGV